MYASDRAMAAFYAILGVVALGLLLFFYLAIPPTMRQGMVFVTFYMFALVFGGGIGSLIGAVVLYARNRPAHGRNEDDVRRNIKRWYRDAKKWMDEHPEHVEMKDL